MTEKEKKRESESSGSSDPVSRRAYLVTAGGAVVGLAVGAAAVWLSKPAVTPPGPTVTVTTTPTPTPTPKPMPTPTPTPTPTIVTKHFNWDWITEHSGNYMKAVFKKFEEENPNIKVMCEGVTSLESREKLLKLIAAGDAPDSAIIQDQEIMDFFEMGAVIPLDDYFKPDLRGLIFDSIIEGMTLPDGHIYGVPWTGNVDVTYYNRKLFEAEGIDIPPYEPGKPAYRPTGDEFIEWCIATTKDTDGDGKIDQWGLTIEWLRPRYSWDNFHQAHLGRYFEEGKCVLNNKAGVETLELLTKLYAELKVVYPETIKSWECRNLFGLGKIGLWVDGSWNFTIWAKDFPQFLPNENYSCCFQPSFGYEFEGRSILGFILSTPMAIMKQSKRPDVAWKLLYAFAFDEFGAREHTMMAGYTPFRKDWEKIGIDLAHGPGKGLDQIFVDEMPYLRHIGRYKSPSIVNDRLTKAIFAAIFQEKTPQKALDDAVAEIHGILGITA